MSRLKTIEWAGNAVRIVDQTCLPAKLCYEDITTVEVMFEAIRALRVRGAPAIGIAAGFGMYLAVREFPETGSVRDFLTLFEKNIDYLAGARPTAVNLSWALQRVKTRIAGLAEKETSASLKRAVFDEAQAMLEEDRASGRAIGEHGFGLLKDCETILTHCNAGGLATAEFGTALAPVYVAAERNKKLHVYSDETRPLLQGSRITAFELKAAGIPVTVLCDNAAASLLRKKTVDAVIVGADRIASNGDVANKIGTYGLALAARAAQVPFYVAAPLSTFDPSLATGNEIPIEERDDAEVTCGFGRRTAPEGVDVYNPAFDVTPHDLVTALITEKGVLRPPYGEAIRKALQG
ncbi:MAG: S-methyl-5-thioribose-1-phosphate isomerase [Chitinivibrionales bacterium]|nr:S-methyl-5-thioribose-1-phosphate isomerase [Chitinivibrionales bacterium]MBD3395655.1 S-methyl-5-thioribose-1-phosphate isomerase [Chitinivibrionales bacterium]